MHRRIMHPISLSFIACLTQVGEDALRRSFTAHSDSIPIAKRSDAMLGALLLSMRDEGQIESVVMSKCTNGKFYSTLSHLLAAFEELVNKKLEAKGPEGYEGLAVYNKTTCYEFHQLVVTTALAYRDALNAFIDAENKLTLEKENADKAARLVAKQEKGKEKARVKEENLKKKARKEEENDCGRTQGSKSVAGDQHREQGDKGKGQTKGNLGMKRQESVGPGAQNLSRNIDVDPKVAIQTFTDLRNECAEQLWRCAVLFWRITYSQAFSYHLFILRAGRLINNPLHTYTQSFSSKDNIDQSVQDEVDWLLHAYGGTESVDKAFRQWSRLQCNHIAAFSVLVRSLGSLRVSLVDQQYPKSSDLGMEHWETTLTDLLAKDPQKNCGSQPPNSPKVPETGKDTPNSFDAETVIRLLKTKVDQFAAVKGSNSVYHAFKPKKETPNSYNPDFYGNTHCESDMGSFFMNPEAAVKASDKNAIHLKEIAKVCFT
jgi:hypothetical protein